jgi:hypothetical protein
MNQQQLLRLEVALLDPALLKREPFARLLAPIRKTQLPLKNRLYPQPLTRPSRLLISKSALQQAALAGSDSLNTPDERGVHSSLDIRQF